MTIRKAEQIIEETSHLRDRNKNPDPPHSPKKKKETQTKVISVNRMLKN